MAASAQQRTSTSPSLVFDGVTVVDVEHGKLVPDQRVVIVGNRIQAVKGAGAVKLPKGARVVDARGKYLIPGLWDMHVHPFQKAPDFYPRWIAYGVTGIRDAHSDVPLATQLQWRGEILAGARVGPPRQILTGLALDDQRVSVACHTPFGSGTGHLCLKTPADVRRVVDSLKAAGADMIKAYLLGREMYFALADEARRVGIPFGGHLLEMSAQEASDSGVSIVDHARWAGGLDTACLWSTASLGQCGALAKHLRRHGTWWAPTLVNRYWRNHKQLTQEAGSERPAAQLILAGIERFAGEAGADSVPRRYEVHVTGGPGTARPPHAAPSASGSGAPSRGLLEIAHRVGLPIVAATDNSGRDQAAGANLHAELAFYTAEGLTPLAALQSATLNPAKMWRATDSLGTVAAGKLADLVLLDANPLADITNTTTIRAVVANGRYFDRAALDGLLTEVRAKASREPRKP